MQDNDNETYQFVIKILNVEIINVQLAINNMSGRHAAISTILAIAAITIVGVYGKHFVDLFNYVTK